MSTQDFMAVLLKAVPELQPLYREHLAFYDEMLPHILMDEVTMFAVAASHSDDPASADILARLVPVLEGGMSSGDYEIENLVSVSFLFDLNGSDYSKLQPLFGPALQKQFVLAVG